MNTAAIARRVLQGLFRLAGKEAYCQDGLISIHNHEFMKDGAFIAAYARGIQAGGCDYAMHWRIHVALWAAHCATRLRGDFVECGVGRGFISSAILTHINWNALNRHFYLLDMFDSAGLPEQTASVFQHRSKLDMVQNNFLEWKNLTFIPGPIPDTLGGIQATEIAYLHIDLNSPEPEVAAISHLWDRLVPNAMVLLDDYAYSGYETSKHAMDAFATSKGVSILSIPTGQGLLIKPYS